MQPPVAALSKPSSWPMTVGAVGIAAAQFARCGFDVMIQAGHDKPWYDLAVTKAGNLFKVAVKPSEDRHWCLVQSYLKRAAHLSGKPADAQGAIDLWLDIHGSRTLYCLVQFEGVELSQMPHIYVATPPEIAVKLRQTAERLGAPILYEQYEWTQPETGFGTIEALPASWLFSVERIDELMSSSQGSGTQHRDPIELRPQRVSVPLETALSA